MATARKGSCAVRLEVGRGDLSRGLLLLGLTVFMAWAIIPAGLCFAVDAHLTDDAFISSAQGAKNYGTNVLLTVQGGASSFKKSFLKFDLSTLPAGISGSLIAKATLRLFVNKVRTPGVFRIYRVTESWNEGDITGETAPLCDATIIATFDISQPNVFVTADLTGLVSDWVDGTAPNNGIALVPGPDIAVDLDSKENKTTSHEARLEITLQGAREGASNNQTRLLFPFVTNQNTWDTGIAIANTTDDPFSTSHKQGTCTLHYYNGASTNPHSQTTATIPAGGTTVFSLSQGGVVGDPNPILDGSFQGYAIAVCNFPLAHGFYLISDRNTVNRTGAAGGHALVLPSTRTTSLVESLGQ